MSRRRGIVLSAGARVRVRVDDRVVVATVVRARGLGVIVEIAGERRRVARADVLGLANARPG